MIVSLLRGKKRENNTENFFFEKGAAYKSSGVSEKSKKIFVGLYIAFGVTGKRESSDTCVSLIITTHLGP